MPRRAMVLPVGRGQLRAAFASSSRVASGSPSVAFRRRARSLGTRTAAIASPRGVTIARSRMSRSRSSMRPRHKGASAAPLSRRTPRCGCRDDQREARGLLVSSRGSRSWKLARCDARHRRYPRLRWASSPFPAPPPHRPRRPFTVSQTSSPHPLPGPSPLRGTGRPALRWLAGARADTAPPPPASTAFREHLWPLLWRYRWPILAASVLCGVHGGAMALQNVYPKWFFTDDKLEARDSRLRTRR